MQPFHPACTPPPHAGASRQLGTSLRWPTACGVALLAVATLACAQRQSAASIGEEPLAADSAGNAVENADTSAAHALRADFVQQDASRHIRRVADRIVASADHLQRPFLVVDKVHARLFVFGADGVLRANAPVLLGAARGDDSVPGIGLRRIADIRPAERTTPAGRFLSEAGHNAKGEDIVWVDYDAAISMHRVRATNPAERRLQRLATPTVADNRISYGCINVPAAFFDTQVAPIFQTGRAYVYVLPEVRSDAEVFHWQASASAAPTSPAAPR